mgnify:CR=1 FL=1
MRIVYFLGDDSSIFYSVNDLTNIEKYFQIKRIKNISKKTIGKDIFILDDSSKNFLKYIKMLRESNKKNFIITTNKENISISSLNNLKIFFKPLRILELNKEIKKRLNSNQKKLKFILNKSSLSMKSKDGIELKMTEKEFKLTELLYNSKNYQSKIDLLYKVWGLKLKSIETLNTRVLETLISRIRKKMVQANFKIKIVRNKNGYILRD